MKNPISFRKDGGSTPWVFTWKGLEYQFSTYKEALHFWGVLYFSEYKNPGAIYSTK